MSTSLEPGMVVTDSITALGPGARGSVIVCGSHGAHNAAQYAVAARVRAALFNDAGVGKNSAGISGLADLEAAAILGATVGYMSARIGDGQDTLIAGTISYTNQRARGAGVREGMAAREAVRLMTAYVVAHATLVLADDSGHLRPPAVVDEMEKARIVLIDSVSQVAPGYETTVVVTGSHGGRVDGRAVKHPVFAAFFNNAGVGKGMAGISRLSLLDEAGVAGLAVDYRSAQIGDAKDTYEHGTVSHVNNTARLLGIGEGIGVKQAAHALLQSANRL